MKKLGRNDLYALPGSMEIVPLPAQKSYKEVGMGDRTNQGRG